LQFFTSWYTPIIFLHIDFGHSVLKARLKKFEKGLFESHFCSSFNKDDDSHGLPPSLPSCQSSSKL
jgi:hypothetical protein